MIRHRRWTAVLGAAAAVTVALPVTAAGAAPGSIGNGDFEADPVGAGTVTGWTVHQDLVDLGVTSLGGCVSQDTTSYTGLRDWDDHVRPVPVRDVPVGAQEQLLHPVTGDEVWIDAAGLPTTAGSPGARQVFHGFAPGDGTESFRDFYVYEGGVAYWRTNWGQATGSWDLVTGFRAAVEPWYDEAPDRALRADDVPPAAERWFYRADPEVVGGIVGATQDPDSWYTVDPLPRSRALALSTWAMTWEPGVVVHGPAAVSDPFAVGSDRTVALDWVAPSSIGGFMDSSVQDHHVLAYVLDVDTCRPYELLDSTGGTTDWQTASVALPAAGTYRVVVVAGGYDRDWSGSASSLLYVDDVRVVPTITGAGVVLEPGFAQGDRVAGAPLQLFGSGLRPNSPWTAELHSTPVTLASGTTDASGNFSTLTSLPSSVEPGKHRIILSGTAPDGSPRSDTVWITVTESGSLGYVSLAAEQSEPGSTPPAGSDGDGPAAGGGADGEPSVGGPADPGGEPAADPRTPTLARTGFESGPWLGLGAGLVAVGGVVLAAARRRTARG